MQEVTVNVTIDKVKNSPEYDSSKPLEIDYAKQLHNHYSIKKDNPEL